MGLQYILCVSSAYFALMRGGGMECLKIGERERMQQHARKVLPRYVWRRRANVVEEIYHEVIDRC